MSVIQPTLSITDAEIAQIASGSLTLKGLLIDSSSKQIVKHLPQVVDQGTKQINKAGSQLAKRALATNSSKTVIKNSKKTITKSPFKAANFKKFGKDAMKFASKNKVALGVGTGLVAAAGLGTYVYQKSKKAKAQVKIENDKSAQIDDRNEAEECLQEFNKCSLEYIDAIREKKMTPEILDEFEKNSTRLKNDIDNGIIKNEMPQKSIMILFKYAQEYSKLLQEENNYKAEEQYDTEIKDLLTATKNLNENLQLQRKIFS